MSAGAAGGAQQAGVAAAAAAPAPLGSRVARWTSVAVAAYLGVAATVVIAFGIVEFVTVQHDREQGREVLDFSDLFLTVGGLLGVAACAYCALGIFHPRWPLACTVLGALPLTGYGGYQWARLVRTDGNAGWSTGFLLMEALKLGVPLALYAWSLVTLLRTQRSVSACR
ncbi:MAG: hypothetical protein RL148_1223 [Planctomycetota bacterium]